MHVGTGDTKGRRGPHLGESTWAPVDEWIPSPGLAASYVWALGSTLQVKDRRCRLTLVPLSHRITQKSVLVQVLVLSLPDKLPSVPFSSLRSSNHGTCFTPQL